jgi:hypothetical protein
MKQAYADIFEEAFQAVRAGMPIEQVTARFPEHGGALRDDLELALNLRVHSRALPPPPATGSDRMRDVLASERRRRAQRRGPWLGLPLLSGLLPRVVAVAVVVLAAIGLWRISGGLASFSSTAEASTIEGVVVENQGEVLTLQTEEGVQSVRLTQASITDTDGSPLEATGIEPGQFLQVSGKPLGAGLVAARKVRLQQQSELAAWCARHVAGCQASATHLQQRLDQCPTNAPACQAIGVRLQEVRALAAVILRLQDVKARCDGGQAASCRELNRACSERAEVCRVLKLRKAPAAK